MSAERIGGLVARMQEAEGPPPGLPTSGVEFLLDEAHGTAVSLQFYATAEDMAAGAATLNAMDAGETPGTRVPWMRARSSSSGISPKEPGRDVARAPEEAREQS